MRRGVEECDRSISARHREPLVIGAETRTTPVHRWRPGLGWIKICQIPYQTLIVVISDDEPFTPGTERKDLPGCRAAVWNFGDHGMIGGSPQQHFSCARSLGVLLDA